MIGKKAIILNDACGSCINDVLSYYYAEGLYLLEQGVAAPSQIDKAAKAFYTLGPCESIDFIGIPLTTRIMENKLKASKEGMTKSMLLYKLISQNRLGKNYGKGLYYYHGDTVAEDPPEFYICEDQKHSRPYAGNNDAGNNDAGNNETCISNRLLLSVFNGFLYNLSRGTCSKEDLDKGIKELLGMPEGPLALAKSIGKNKMMEEFHTLADMVGIRFKNGEQTGLIF